MCRISDRCVSACDVTKKGGLTDWRESTSAAAADLAATPGKEQDPKQDVRAHESLPETSGGHSVAADRQDGNGISGGQGEGPDESPLSGKAVEKGVSKSELEVLEDKVKAFYQVHAPERVGR